MSERRLKPTQTATAIGPLVWSLLAGVTGAFVVAGVASAQVVPPTSSAPPPAAVGSPDASAGLTLDAPIEVLRNDPRARAVVDKELPDLAKHPAYDQFKSVSLKQLAPYSEGVITPEILERIAAGLKALPPKS